MSQLQLYHGNQESRSGAWFLGNEDTFCFFFFVASHSRVVSPEVVKLLSLCEERHCSRFFYSIIEKGRLPVAENWGGGHRTKSGDGVAKIFLK